MGRRGDRGLSLAPRTNTNARSLAPSHLQQQRVYAVFVSGIQGQEGHHIVVVEELRLHNSSKCGCTVRG